VARARGPVQYGGGGTWRRMSRAMGAMLLKIGEVEPLTSGVTRHSAGRGVKPEFEYIQMSLNDFKLFQNCFDPNRTFPSSKNLK
jgi:hypothetical protein